MRDGRRTYGRSHKPAEIVYAKDFVVDGQQATLFRNRAGETWVEMNGERFAVEVDNEGRTRVHLPRPRSMAMDFPELEDLGTQAQAATDVVNDEKPVAERVCFIGVGQAGCKIADTFYEKGYRRVLLLNTTEQDMAGLVCPNRLLIGKDKRGAGKNPAVGAKAVADSSEEITRAAYKAFGSDFERVIVCTSGGGGTGSGATPEMVKLIRAYMTEQKKDPKVGVIVCAPKLSEGATSKNNYVGLLADLRSMTASKLLSPLVVVDNEKIGRLYPNTPIAKFFAVANQNIVGLYNVFNELAAQSSPYSTLDPADYKSILDSGVIVLGMTNVTESSDPTAIAKAIESNAAGGLLSDEVTVKGATHAGAILVTSKATLEQTPQSNLDRAFEALGRVLGGGQGLCLHQGIYEGPEKLTGRLLIYTISNASFV